MGEDMSNGAPKTAETLIVEPTEQPRTAEEFLRMLDPLSDQLAVLSGNDSKPLIYRGVQRESIHRLIPTAFRSDSPLRSIKIGLGTPYFDELEIACIIREAVALREFVDRCNEVCLPLPVDVDLVIGKCKAAERAAQSVMVSYYTSGGRPISDFEWPPPEIMSCLSLAQHYGVPTRLLDFTDSCRHAAFFASDFDPTKLSTIDRQTNRGIAVYCMRPNFADTLDSGADDAGDYRHGRPLRFGNANASAQLGSFVYRVGVYYDWNKQGWKDLHKPDRMRALESVECYADEPIGVRITCPFEQVSRVQNLLERQGVARRHVYPGYSTIAEELRQGFAKFAE